jgi:hypothetical protein
MHRIKRTRRERREIVGQSIDGKAARCGLATPEARADEPEQRGEDAGSGS